MKRKLGNSEIEVEPLMLGGNPFGWTIDEETSFKVLDTFFDNGFNFIDTADVYSAWKPGNVGGESETIIGNWVKNRGNRSQVIIATKVGFLNGGGKSNLSKANIAQAVEDSLRRLQTDYIDLYQSHGDDGETPLRDSLEAFNELVQAGKVRVIGASNFSGARLREAIEVSRAHGFARYESLQPHYNLIERSVYESDLAPVVSELGIGVVPYFSLAAGFLTGKYRSKDDLAKSKRGSGVEKYLNERGLRILSALDKAAKQYDATPGKIAIAWLIAQPTITAPIASATSAEQVLDLIASTKIELSQETIAELNEASTE